MKAICNTEDVEVYKQNEMLVNEDNNGRVFDYTINKKRAKAKLLKGSKRANNLEVEIKNGCVNLLFSDGAYVEIVLPLMRLWNRKVNEVFFVNQTEVKVIEIDAGIEESGNHVDTKLVITANNKRFVLHAYNGTQNLMVQGKNYENFAVNCLKPFFEEKIQESIQNITKYYDNIREALTNKPIRTTKHFTCPQCEVIKETNAALKGHMKICHTKPGLSSPRNKVPKIMNEDVSIIALDEPMLPLIEDALSCDLCDFEPKNEKELKTHLESIHSITVKKKISPHIGQKHLMNLEKHYHEDEMKTSTPNKDLKSNLDEESEKYTKSKSRDKIECDKCDTTVSSQEGLDEHLKEKH